MPVENAVVRVTKKFHFEMAHALTGHDGPCKNIHGHSYALSITVLGTPIEISTDPKNGMVIDFADLKKMVMENVIAQFDHTLVLNETDREKKLVNENEVRVMYVPFAPTCEMLLLHFHQLLHNKIPAHIKLQTLRLDETVTSYAEWHAGDN